MQESVIEALRKIVGQSNLIVEKDKIGDYLRDETPEPVRPEPAKDIVVARPANKQEIAEIIKFANKNKIYIFPRGGGTGLVGGAIPARNGVVLSLERMKKIEIDKENLMAIVEAGATLESLVVAADNAGLSFPLHPGDESAQIGGLVATNAGGANSIKHGVMRNYVKGIEIVLPNGEIMDLGGKLQKNNVGYDLMDVVIGSEGTLCVITKVILRLTSKFACTATLIVPYNNRHDALNTVPRILQDGRMPIAIEYVEKDLMEKTAKTLGEDWPVKEGRCYLLIKLAESSRDQVLFESQKIAEICQENHCLEILFSEPINEQKKILRIRSNLYSAMKQETADILDVTVPPANIGRLIDAVDEIARKHGVSLPTYGHAGDGNLHIHIMREREQGEDYIRELRNEVYTAGLSLDGVITGEHGIGRTRLGTINQFFDNRQIQLMKGIKQVFDPNGILNPEVKIPI